MQRFSRMFLVAFSFLAAPHWGQTCLAQSVRLGPLVSPQQLNSVQNTDAIRVVEVGQDVGAFQEGHLPEAVFVDWVADIIDQQQLDRYNLFGRAEMESLMSRLGITPQTHVVLYDRLFSRLATRMYWSLKYYGHDRVHVLDGGQAAWVSAGFPLDEMTRNIHPTRYQIQNTNEQYAVEMDFIKAHLNRRDVQLVDGRPPGQFTGEELGRVFHTGKPHRNSGHIPGAVNVFWKDNFNEDGTFRSVQSLRELYRERGIRKDATVVTYCNEGLHAAPPWFVLKELLGYKDVRVYDDSMSEWANEAMPMESK